MRRLSDFVCEAVRTGKTRGENGLPKKGWTVDQIQSWLRTKGVEIFKKFSNAIPCPDIGKPISEIGPCSTPDLRTYWIALNTKVPSNRRLQYVVIYTEKQTGYFEGTDMVGHNISFDEAVKIAAMMAEDPYCEIKIEGDHAHKVE